MDELGKKLTFLNVSLSVTGSGAYSGFAVGSSVTIPAEGLTKADFLEPLQEGAAFEEFCEMVQMHLAENSPLLAMKLFYSDLYVTPVRNMNLVRRKRLQTLEERRSSKKKFNPPILTNTRKDVDR